MGELEKPQPSPLDVTWRGVAWRAAVVLGLLLLTTALDFFGWIKLDAGSSYYPTILVAMIIIAAIGASQRNLRSAQYYGLALALLLPGLLGHEADRVKEAARWRIVLMGVCADADPSSELAQSCSAARVRADYEPCDFGTTAEQCRRELYRDAEWPLVENPIPPHQYGDTLPLVRDNRR